MKWVRIKLFGLDHKLYEMLSPAAQKGYQVKILGILISTIMSIAISIEVAHSIIGEFDWGIMLPVSGFFALMIFTLDVILSRMGKKLAVFRLIFSICLIGLSTTSIFTLINRPTIETNLKNKVSANVSAIDSTYYADKEIRYQGLKLKEQQLIDYEREILNPEALNGGAFSRYERKKKYKLKLEKEIEDEKVRLDKEEELFYSRYVEEKAEADGIPKIGLFELVKKTYLYIFSDIVSIVLFFILGGLLLALESIVFFISLSNISEEYDHLNSIKQNKLRQHNESKLEAWKNNLDVELEKENKLKQARGKLDLLRSFINIKEGFEKAKSIEPELFTNQANSTISDFISSEINAAKNSLDDYLNSLEIINSDTLSVSDDINSDQLITDSKDNLSGYYNIFYSTKPMKELADKLWAESNNSEYDFCKAVFDWSVTNINYQKSHDLEHYKTGREVFNSRSGICGEMAIFYKSILKYKGVSSDYVHVDKDSEGKLINHACAGVALNGKYILIDIAYATFDINHQKWNKVTDSELIKNMKRWNQ